jgi:hypothetical protein
VTSSNSPNVEVVTYNGITLQPPPANNTTNPPVTSPNFPSLGVVSYGSAGVSSSSTPQTPPSDNITFGSVDVTTSPTFFCVTAPHAGASLDAELYQGCLGQPNSFAAPPWVSGNGILSS